MKISKKISKSLSDILYKLMMCELPAGEHVTEEGITFTMDDHDLLTITVGDMAVELIAPQQLAQS